MPNSPRQNFIVKINQCINLFNTVEGYLDKIKDYVKDSEFFIIIDEVYDKTRMNITILLGFLKKVNSNGSFIYKRRG